MKQLTSLFASIIFLLFLNSCGGGSSSNNGDTPPVENTPPIADAGEDKIVHVNDTVNIIGSGSDADGAVVSYEWKEGSTILANTAAFNYTPTTIAIHTLTLTVTDNDGATDSDTMDVNATSVDTNIPPVADAGEDKIVLLDEIVTITGSGSDTDGTVDSYEWKEGSTILANTAAFNYTAPSLGIHTLTFTITDNDGATDSDTMDVNATSFPDAVPHDPSFESLHFSGSQNCAQCHDGISDTSNSKDVSIVKTWQGTMMDNASIDPLYLAKVASEVKRNPNFKAVIESKCSRCHMPMANVEADFAGDTIAMSGDGFLNPDNPYYNAAKDGVSCTLCHQIENDPKFGTDEGFSGGFSIDTNHTGIERKTYGPYTSPKTQPMINNVQFTPAYSAHMNDSKLCASCHNLDTPVIDANGNLTDPLLTFPEQAVYTEWEYSDFNATKSCQDCHMPKTEGSVIISTQGGNLEARSPFYQHQFLGANTYMLEIMKNNRIKLGAIADDTAFNKSITNTREFLKAAADVNIIDTNFANGTLDFSVLVHNHSGHKFPTSLPSRRAWLHVKVTNVANQTVFESGALNSNGQIIGVDDSNEYEPHYRDINNSSQVQVYEPIMADTDNKQTYTFMQASKYLKDNRILPLGHKNNTPSSAQPYGEATNDDDFVGGSDTVIIR
ncbi:MAG: PKD domain-containing protein [Sulfurovum sp.]|nr:PKD domain-containing protein [Sulfurovum sp.]